jgi:gentisate 1,2-dioxygenase
MPCWKRYRLEADEESVLFAASDRDVQARLGLLREG